MISVQHDSDLDIAIGGSRNTTKWKNKQIKWSELVNKLSSTHRTAETYKAYVAAAKDRQDEIKDIGGFVGGYLAGGKRSKSSVLHRQIVTLDIDFGTSHVWPDFLLKFDCAAVLYSTHKHSAKSPRYRLVIPLSREVKDDEYVAIARRIAGDIDIEIFDNTTFQPSRLMYWPSTSKDGEYVFKYQDGDFLDADEILQSYTDWTDSSEWPVSEAYETEIIRALKKQGDPTQKGGIVGAFCRTFPITEAIEKFLPGIYEPTDIEDRYTYVEGSTSGGLVLYEDMFTYSHHGTDPTSGKLCNAFDLVRLHLYGTEDEDTPDNTPVNRLPSYKAMCEFATKDPQVRKCIAKERILEAREDFEEIEEGEEITGDEDWLAKMDVDQKGKYYATVDNVVLIMENDPALSKAIALNNFDKREVALKNLPWRKVTPTTANLIDKDDAGLRYYIEKTYGISSAGKIKDGLDIILLKNSFHPVKDYLKSVTWDGEERVDTLLIDFLGAEDTEYTRAVTRKFLVAAVARIFTPGVKFDHVLTLVGREGIGKSHVFDKLGKEWFSDSFTTIKGKEAYEQLQGVWIIEMAELTALNRTEGNAAKHFISKRSDRFRVAYGKRTEDFPRQCVFAASTNEDDFLKGYNGNRKFWPVRTEIQDREKDVFKDLTPEVVNYIWGEVMNFYRAGETLYLDAVLEDTARTVIS